MSKFFVAHKSSETKYFIKKKILFLIIIVIDYIVKKYIIKGHSKNLELLIIY